MLCKKCGEQIPENETKCPKCGAEVEETFDSTDSATPEVAESEYIESSPLETAPKGFKNKKNIIIIIAAAVVLIIGAVTAIAIGTSNRSSGSVSAQIELAEKYLSEQNYEQAVIEFQKAIEIDPMNVDAYLGLAEAYIGMGDMDKAIEILKEGWEKTGYSRLKKQVR